MSTHPSTGFDRDGQNKNVDLPAMVKSTDSNGVFKSKRNCNRKRKKLQKWAPLDLTAPEITSEAEEKLEVETDKDLASNNFGLVHDTGDPDQIITTDRLDTAIKGEKSSGGDKYTWDGIDSKPPPVTDSAVALLSVDGSTVYGGDASLMQSDPAFADTPETKNKFAIVMAHLQQCLSPTQAGSGGDGFDSLDWDPDLPSASPPDKSPEPVTAEPKPMAYTTVGSVVNPNIVPQFSAPNRIQRVGAARRPLITMTNRQYDHLLQPRAPQHSLNAQNSMQYTQQLLQSSSNLEADLPIPSRSILEAARRVGPTTETEQQVMSLVNKRTPTRSMSVSRENAISGFFQDFQDGNRNRTSGSLGLSQAMEKMQTLQRLARFENPMQEHAIYRLSELSVSNAKTQTASHGNPNQGSNLNLRYDESHAATSINTYCNSQDGANHGHRFSQSALGSSSVSQANPLFGAYSASTHNSSAVNRPPPGYPQPLTAGPPGQRPSTSHAKSTTAIPGSEIPNYNGPTKFFQQNRVAAGHATNVDNDFDPEMFLPRFLGTGYMNDSDAGSSVPAFRESHQGSEAMNYSMQHLSGLVQSAWDPTMQQRAKANNRVLVGQAYSPLELGPRTDIRDTLSPNSMAKYYPHGRPFHLGSYRPLGAADELKIKALLNESPAEREKELRQVATNDVFYHGQRLYHMTAEQHIEELEKRQPGHGTNPFGPIGPPVRKYPSIVKEQLTPEQMESMTVAEAAAPILDAAFSTLLAYSETSKYSRTKVSGWVPCPARYIDNTVEGAKSIFGEGSVYAIKSKRPSLKPFMGLSGEREKCY